MSSSVENTGGEEAAWAEVLLAWDDEARHRAYLARFPDLDGLAVAGRRYREVLAQRPADPVAAQFRDEVVRRAMAQGLASIPRTSAPHQPRTFARAAAVAFAIGLGAAAWLMARDVGAWIGARP